MFINADTLQSLQIIDTESHPNSQNQGPRSSGSKEGLSVYGIFHHLARTPQGKHRLRQWFLRPTMDVKILQQRQRSIATFIRPDNATQIAELSKNLQRMPNLRSNILRLRKGVTLNLPIKSASSKSIWSRIRSVSCRAVCHESNCSQVQFVFHALKVRDLIQEVHGSERLDIRNKVKELLIVIQQCADQSIRCYQSSKATILPRSDDKSAMSLTLSRLPLSTGLS